MTPAHLSDAARFAFARLADTMKGGSATRDVMKRTRLTEKFGDCQEPGSVRARARPNCG